MNRKAVSALATSLVVLTSIATVTNSHAAELPFDVLSATPVGSWQVREMTSTDASGKQRVNEVRTALVGEEERDGKPCVWIEMEMTNFEMKKGERKKKGDTTIMKALVKRSAFGSDPANIVNNLQAFGEEIIIQTGDKDPMRITGGGAMAQGMLQAMGTKVTFDFSIVGDEKVSTPAGSFDCTKVTGKGSTEMKVIIKTIKVDSESEMWLSKDVPFAFTKSSEKMVVNGKPESSESIVREIGKSGAVSKITKKPTEMPNLGGMFGK